jgi:hypothetical protein
MTVKTFSLHIGNIAEREHAMSIVTVTETQSYTVDWTKLAKGVARLVEAKLRQDLAKWKQAEARVRDMDTAPRDYVYDFIAEVAGADFFDLVK